jgi:hypothetical protein
LKDASGVKGAFGDINVADADFELAKSSLKIFGRGLLGDKDRITTKGISTSSEMPVSLATGSLFGIISGYKIPLLRFQEGYNRLINTMTAGWQSRTAGR